MSGTPDKRKPIKIDPATYELLKQYSEITGIAITRVLTEAIRDWYEVVGLTRIEKLTGRKH